MSFNGKKTHTFNISIIKEKDFDIFPSRGFKTNQVEEKITENKVLSGFFNLF